MPADRASLVACAHLPRPDQHTSALPQYRSSVASVRWVAVVSEGQVSPAAGDEYATALRADASASLTRSPARHSTTITPRSLTASDSSPAARMTAMISSTVGGSGG